MVGAMAVVVATGMMAAPSGAEDVFPEEPPIESSADALASATRGAQPQYRFPVVTPNPEYGRSHHDYPATDVAVACGTPLVALTDGVIWEVVRTDRYNPVIDVPAYRGGKTVVLDGDDGVRYLYAHLSSIRSTLMVGQRVSPGDDIGAVGSTGRSTGCHFHLGLSPQCPGRVWDLLAGTVWPWPFLDAWLAGESMNPGSVVRLWSEAHPDACGGQGVIAPADGIDIESEIVAVEPPLSPPRA